MADDKQITTKRPHRVAVQRPAMNAQGSAGMSITPKEIVDILRRHLFLIISFTVLGMVAGGGGWFLLSRVAPKFTARTYIEVLSPGQSDPTKIGTTLANKDIAYEFRFSKAALIKQQNMLQELIRRDKIRQTKWFSKFDNDIVEIIDSLKKNLGASADRNSSYISVSMTCGDAREAATIVNEMVDLFVKEQQTDAQAGVSMKLADLRQQENSLRSDITNYTNSMNDMRRSTGLTQLDDSGSEGSFRHTITQKLAGLEVQKSTLEADIEQVRASVTNYEDRTALDDIVRRTTENDQVVVYLIQRITSLESELARKLTNLGENHREVQQLREVLRQTVAEKDARSNMKSQQIRESDITSARDQLSVMTSRLAKLEELRSQTEIEQRELDSTRATYDQLISQREEAKEKLFATQEQISKYNLIKQDRETAKVKSVGLAPPPLQMSSPKLLVFVPGGTFLGMMLGLGLAFLIELLNDLLRSPSDVMKFTDVSLLGMITHKNLDPATKKADMWQVTRQLPLSMMSECYRQFKTNVQLSSDIENQRVIFVTSGNASEGRTTIAANTASVFAAEDKRVLLVDTNFRRPTSHKIFPQSQDLSEPHGLSDYLTGSCSVEQIIRHTGVGAMDVVDSGVLPSNPAELLAGDSMAEFIKYARGRYDRVIIDGPPMLVSDAKSLACLSDGVILVFNAAVTRRGVAKRIVRELREAHTNILGAVLVGVRVLKGGYFREMIDSYQEYQEVQKA